VHGRVDVVELCASRQHRSAAAYQVQFFQV
jgi:hypothetical protein